MKSHDTCSSPTRSTSNCRSSSTPPPSTTAAPKSTFTPTTSPPSSRAPFSILDLSSTPTKFLHFTTELTSSCIFGPDVFETIMDNLIRNPNLTSTHLFRADIFWDSVKDARYEPDACYIESNGHDHDQPIEVPLLSTFVKHMRAELRPKVIKADGFRLTRSLVRQLVPRNPQLDRPLVQTCHFMRERRRRQPSLVDGEVDGETAGQRREQGGEELSWEEERNLVIYLPHIDTADEMPWYHPKVQALAFLHTWQARQPPASTEGHTSTSTTSSTRSTTPSHAGTISLHILAFPTTPPLPRLTRTLHSLLRILYKHGNGVLAGYTKRVHHDQIVPQARVQDTYSRLKSKYAKDLLGCYWKEQTDATKGVFEDLGIAAFLIECWHGMYRHEGGGPADREEAASVRKPQFPGFVDIGCGNGVLVFILLAEGYRGWGFDARRRKTWDAFPEEIGGQLKEMMLVPSIFNTKPDDSISDNFHSNSSPNTVNGETQHPTPLNLARTCNNPAPIHNGTFPPGTFIISNHADELTPWTPLLAFLSDCPFLCIPCCSHDLSGAKFRAPLSGLRGSSTSASASTSSSTSTTTHSLTTCPHPNNPTNHYQPLVPPANHTPILSPATPNLTKPTPRNLITPAPISTGRPPSAYATLCAYVTALATECGLTVEREVLRIPSTRNVGIVLRTLRGLSAPEGEGVEVQGEGDGEMERRRAKVCAIVEREIGRGVEVVGMEWVGRARGIVQSRGRNH